MSCSFTPKVITANALLEGDVIYWSPEGTWVRTLAGAEVFENGAVAQEQLLTASSQPAVAVGVYLAEVAITDDGLATTHFREEFRARGPSNYAHGKQVELS